jgi:hypothetical protein
MGQKVTITLVDDLDGTPIDDGKGETLKFGIDGADYEIDLSAKNAERLREALEPFVEAARSTNKRTKATAAGSRSSSPSTSSKEELTAAREWLRSEGHQVSNRGRISGDMMELYRNAKK